MSRARPFYATKDQAQHYLEALNRNAINHNGSLPEKGKRLIIALPRSMDDWAVDLIEIEKTDRKATYGGALYAITQTSRKGREIDATIQEAHVVTFYQYTFEMRRQEKLALYEQQSVSFIPTP